MSLQDEIAEAQRLVKTDAYQLSLGEVINMYRDGELIINPSFQRLFRWEIGQKSKLIESILLGIPIPSIFVFERDDAKWELIDGLQRISTVLEFMGLLRDPDTDKFKDPSLLCATKYLRRLDNVVWEKSDKINIELINQNVLDNALKLSIRRSRISVEILKRPSDNATKYDLFQRLNAGGSPANPQELRNCIIIMVNPDFHKFMFECSEDSDFLTVLAPSEQQSQKQRAMEYVTRFLVYTYVPYDGKLDVEEYLDEGIIQLAESGKRRNAKKAFDFTFKILNDSFGENAFRRQQSGSASGRVSLAAFECIAIGIARNSAKISKLSKPTEFVKERVAKFWESDELDNFFAPGLRGTTRINRTIAFGDSWFKP